MILRVSVDAFPYFNYGTSFNYGSLEWHSMPAMAEFERSLIQERVKAGLRSTRAKGKQLGRPRRIVNTDQITALRAKGTSWRAISEQLDVGLATLYRAVERSENLLATSDPLH